MLPWHTQTITLLRFQGSPPNPTVVLGVLCTVSLCINRRERQWRWSASSTAPRAFSALSWGRTGLAFLNLPVWFCSVNCYEALLKWSRALPSVFFCTLLQLQISCVWQGRWCSTAARAPGVQHAQVLLRPLPVPCSAVTAVWGLGFEVFPGVVPLVNQVNKDCTEAFLFCSVCLLQPGIKLVSASSRQEWSWSLLLIPSAELQLWLGVTQCAQHALACSSLHGWMLQSHADKFSLNLYLECEELMIIIVFNLFSLPAWYYNPSSKSSFLAFTLWSSLLCFSPEDFCVFINTSSQSYGSIGNNEGKNLN